MVSIISYYKYIVKYFPFSLKKQLPRKVAVVSISEKKSQALNKAYRKKDTPANVLSFLYGDDYGEILVCPAVIRREAKEQEHAYAYQMTWMILHGMIHLAGMHHERSKADAKRVENMERKILAQLFNQHRANHES
jgi:probable rRNA maturation factor